MNLQDILLKEHYKNHWTVTAFLVTILLQLAILWLNCNQILGRQTTIAKRGLWPNIYRKLKIATELQQFIKNLRFEKSRSHSGRLVGKFAQKKLALKIAIEFWSQIGGNLLFLRIFLPSPFYMSYAKQGHCILLRKIWENANNGTNLLINIISNHQIKFKCLNYIQKGLPLKGGWRYLN